MKINFKTYAGLTKKWADGELRKAVIKGIRSGALRALPKLVFATDHAPKASDRGRVGAVDTARFRLAWKSRALPAGADIHNDAPYAGVIEHGRRPGTKQPPTKPIAKWAQRRMGLSEDDAKSVAFVVARAIAKRGLRAREVLTRCIQPISRTISAEIRHELTRATSK